MTSQIEALTARARPGVLMRAAHHGTETYNRKRTLGRLLGLDQPPSFKTALERLAVIEHEVNALREAGDAAYSVVRHVEVLIALTAEFRLFKSAEARGEAM
ncbi:MAG: DUF6477 family protein [Pseudomonadota bacterium]